MAETRTLIWVADNYKDRILEDVNYTAQMGPNRNMKPFTNLTIEPTYLNKLIKKYAAARISVISCQVGNNCLEAVVAGMKQASEAKPVYFSSCKLSRTAAEPYLNIKTDKCDLELISILSSTDTVLVPMAGKDPAKFVQAVYNTIQNQAKAPAFFYYPRNGVRTIEL
jgi:hypothetical protein